MSPDDTLTCSGVGMDIQINVLLFLPTSRPDKQGYVSLRLAKEYVTCMLLLVLLLLLLFWFFFFEAESYFVALSGLVFATRSGWPWTCNPSTSTQLLGPQACTPVPSWLVDLYLKTPGNPSSSPLCRPAACVLTRFLLGLMASEVLVTYTSSSLLKHAPVSDLHMADQKSIFP